VRHARRHADRVDGGVRARDHEIEAAQVGADPRRRHQREEPPPVSLGDLAAPERRHVHAPPGEELARELGPRREREDVARVERIGEVPRDLLGAAVRGHPFVTDGDPRRHLPHPAFR
jgi:hypothetical protein